MADEGKRGRFVRMCHDNCVMICPLTGLAHRLLWLRSAWWCENCKQKIETCCEGSCPSVAGEG